MGNSVTMTFDADVSAAAGQMEALGARQSAVMKQLAKEAEQALAREQQLKQQLLAKNLADVDKFRAAREKAETEFRAKQAQAAAAQSAHFRQLQQEDIDFRIQSGRQLADRRAKQDAELRAQLQAGIEEGLAKQKAADEAAFAEAKALRKKKTRESIEQMAHFRQLEEQDMQSRANAARSLEQRRTQIAREGAEARRRINDVLAGQDLTFQRVGLAQRGTSILGLNAPELARGLSAARGDLSQFERQVRSTTMIGNQAVFMVQDFAQVLGTSGLAGGVRAASNNLQQMIFLMSQQGIPTLASFGAILTGPAGIALAAGLAASALVPLADWLLRSGKAAEYTTSELDSLREGMRKLHEERERFRLGEEAFGEATAQAEEEATRAAASQALAAARKRRDEAFAGLSESERQALLGPGGVGAAIEAGERAIQTGEREPTLAEVFEGQPALRRRLEAAFRAQEATRDAERGFQTVGRSIEANRRQRKEKRARKEAELAFREEAEDFTRKGIEVGFAQGLSEEQIAALLPQTTDLQQPFFQEQARELLRREAARRRGEERAARLKTPEELRREREATIREEAEAAQAPIERRRRQRELQRAQEELEQGRVRGKRLTPAEEEELRDRIKSIEINERMLDRLDEIAAHFARGRGRALAPNAQN